MLQTTTETWAAALLADDSDANLLIWADWLEDQDDPACEGVRQLLVAHKLRPNRFPRGFLQLIIMFEWPKWIVGNLPLTMATSYQVDAQYANVDSNAEAHYRALYDAATAYVNRKQPWDSFFSAMSRPKSGENSA